MEPWIVSESDEITSRLRKALQKLDVDCPLSRVISGEAACGTTVIAAESGGVVFITARDITVEQLEIVRCLHATSNAKIVIVSPIADHATVLQAIRACAGDFLNASESLDEELSDLISRFRKEHAGRSSRGKLTTVFPCQANCDGSLLAVNLAAVAAREGANCGLLDFQLRGGELAMHLKLTPRHTLYDLITQRESIDEAMYQQALSAHDSGIHLLAGPPLFCDTNAVQPHTYQHILGLAQASHQHLVLFSDDLIHSERINILSTSDQLVLTMRLDLISLYRAQQHLAYLRRIQIAPEKVHVLAMASGHAGELPFHSVKKVLGVSQIDCVPHDPVSTTISINIGNPLVLELPNAKASQALVQFSRKLFGFTEPAQQSAVRAIGAQLRAATLLTLLVLTLGG